MLAYLRILFFWTTVIIVAGMSVLVFFSHWATDRLVDFLVLGTVPGTQYTVNFSTSLFILAALLGSTVVYRAAKILRRYVKLPHRSNITVRLRA